jgi:hypothetical protein
MDEKLTDLVARGSIPLLPAQVARLANLTPPVVTCASLLLLTEFDLVEQCDWDTFTARNALYVVSQLVAPKGITVRSHQHSLPPRYYRID